MASSSSKPSIERKLVELDIGDLLERAEALGDEQLGERLVDVELVLEHLGALDELALALLAGVGLGHDVDRRAGQLAGEADVLAAAADGEASWSSGTTTSIRLSSSSMTTRLTVAGCSALTTKVARSSRPGDDVDLLALQLLDDRLDAAALHADAGADRVDRAVVADHADLGAAARIAGGGLDLDDAVVNLGHFLREQLLHEVGMGAARGRSAARGSRGGR